MILFRAEVSLQLPSPSPSPSPLPSGSPLIFYDLCVTCFKLSTPPCRCPLSTGALDMCTCVWAHPVCRMQCRKEKRRHKKKGEKQEQQHAAHSTKRYRYQNSGLTRLCAATTLERRESGDGRREDGAARRQTSRGQARGLTTGSGHKGST